MFDEAATPAPRWHPTVGAEKRHRHSKNTVSISLLSLPFSGTGNLIPRPHPPIPHSRLPAHRRRRVVAMADLWDDGNPNRQGAGAKGKAGGGKIRPFPGIPKEEYAVIELLKDDLVADEAVNRANRRLIDFYKKIQSARIEVLETSAEMKKKTKGHPRSRSLAESRPTKPELARLKLILKELMSCMEEKQGEVRHVGGVPIPPPRHFSKGLGV